MTKEQAQNIAKALQSLCNAEEDLAAFERKKNNFIHNLHKEVKDENGELFVEIRLPSVDEIHVCVPERTIEAIIERHHNSMKIWVASKEYKLNNL